jgi:hypothetical protein
MLNLCSKFGNLEKKGKKQEGPDWTPRPSLSQASHNPHELGNLLNLVGSGEARVSWELMVMAPQSSTLLPLFPSPFFFGSSCPSPTPFFFSSFFFSLSFLFLPKAIATCYSSSSFSTFFATSYYSFNKRGKHGEELLSLPFLASTLQS